MPGQVPTYLLVGGPCDGKIGQISPQISSARQLTCQNHVYKEGNPPVIQGGHVIFKDAGALPPPPKPPTEPHAHHGWKSLQRSFNVDLPASLKRAQKSREAALRSLGAGRKVR